MQDAVRGKQENLEEKYFKILDLQFSMVEKLKNLSALIHSEENAGIHQRVILNTIKIYTPVYDELIKIGIQKKIFDTKYSYELSEYMLLIIYFMFDPGFFSLQEDEYKRKIEAFCDIMQKSLGCKTQNDNFISKLKEKCLSIYNISSVK